MRPVQKFKKQCFHESACIRKSILTHGIVNFTEILRIAELQREMLDIKNWGSTSKGNIRISNLANTTEHTQEIYLRYNCV